MKYNKSKQSKKYKYKGGALFSRKKNKKGNDENIETLSNNDVKLLNGEPDEPKKKSMIQKMIDSKAESLINKSSASSSSGMFKDAFGLGSNNDDPIKKESEIK